MKKITYFPHLPGTPAPLSKTVERVVRFNEIDPMGIMWHGHYAGFLEDARVALGDALGIGYQDFYHHHIRIPVRQMHLDYLAPLYYGKTYRICARLFYTEAARLNYDFTITDEQGKICTRGYSVQLMLDEQDNLLLEWPAFTHVFLEKWKNGTVSL